MKGNIILSQKIKGYSENLCFKGKSHEIAQSFLKIHITIFILLLDFEDSTVLIGTS
jgi:hypothetical protein